MNKNILNRGVLVTLQCFQDWFKNRTSVGNSSYTTNQTKWQALVEKLAL